MDQSPSRAELKSTLNQLKAKSKKSMFMKHIKRMYGGNKSKKSNTVKDDDFIPDAVPKKQVVVNDNHVDSTSNLNGNDNNHNNADVSSASIESLGSFKGENKNTHITVTPTISSSGGGGGGKRGRPPKFKTPTDEPVAPTPASSSSRTLEQVVEQGNVKHTPLEPPPCVLTTENGDSNDSNHQVVSNSEIVITKITSSKENEVTRGAPNTNNEPLTTALSIFQQYSSETRKSLSNGELETTVQKEMKEKTTIEEEPQQQQPVTPPEPVTTTNEQNDEIINDDSKDEAELILSQSKTFLRKSSKRLTPLKTQSILDQSISIIEQLSTPKKTGDSTLKRKRGRPCMAKKIINIISNKSASITKPRAKRGRPPYKHKLDNKENSKPTTETIVNVSKEQPVAPVEVVEVVVAAAAASATKRKNEEEEKSSNNKNKRASTRVVQTNKKSTIRASPVAATAKKTRKQKDVSKSKKGEEEEEEEVVIRRSKRTKTSRTDAKAKHLQPIYKYEIIKDYDGNTIRIQKLSGYKSRHTDLTTFREHFWENTAIRNKKQKLNRSSTKKSKNAKKTKRIVNEKKTRRSSRNASKVEKQKQKTIKVTKRTSKRNNNKEGEIITIDDEDDDTPVIANTSRNAIPSIDTINDFAPLANSSIDEERSTKVKQTTKTTTSSSSSSATQQATKTIVQKLVSTDTQTVSQPVSTGTTNSDTRPTTATTATNTDPIMTMANVVKISNINRHDRHSADNITVNHHHHHVNVNTNVHKETTTTTTTAKAQKTQLSESFEDLYNNELYEHVNEVVDVEENSQTVPRNVVRFHQVVDQKEYTELSHGVFATVIGPTEGIIRIDQLQNTITNEHDSDIHYYVQKGYITLKLNDKNILMTIGDAILIPKCNRYELFNPSKNQQAYILFKFDKL